MDGLNPAQREFVEAFRSGNYRYLLAAGSTGSGKSFLTIGLIHLLCSSINDLRFAIIRKSEKNLKLTTIPTYKKVLRETKSSNAVTISDMKAKYAATGSEILFIWADTSKDPDLDNVKGLEVTGALIEECNQIDVRYFNILKTRIGRWNNEKCPQFILLNCNPNAEWPKDVFYTPYTNGVLQPPHFFQEFSISDNPKLSDDYIAGLEDLPEEEKNRFVRNIWDYQDNNAQLIKYEWYKQCAVERDLLPEPSKTARWQLTCDPAWEGTDRTIILNGWDNAFGRWEEYRKQDTTTTGEIILARAQENNIADTDVTIDGVGVGVGVIDTCRRGIKQGEGFKDFRVDPLVFRGGDEPLSTQGFFRFYNRRAEAYWMLREALKNEEIIIEHNASLQKETLAIEYGVTDKKIKIGSKKDLKKKLKFSPDYTDTASMAVWNYKNNTLSASADLFSRQLKELNTPDRIPGRLSFD